MPTYLWLKRGFHGNHPSVWFRNRDFDRESPDQQFHNNRKNPHIEDFSFGVSFIKRYRELRWIQSCQPQMKSFFSKIRELLGGIDGADQHSR